MIVSVGVTASRRGMSPKQQERAFSILHMVDHLVEEAHHGDCIGGDEQFDEFFHILGFRVVIHPPEDDRYRAYCKGAWKVEEPQEYLKRDRDIVRASTLVISAPYSKDEQPRSGTWYTDRYARKKKRDLIRVYRDGTVEPIRYTMSLFSPLFDLFEHGGLNA